ncbi:MAG TPA: aminotransferase class V-fold PLP-dependent enzyme [Dongiaceae bacterium]|nr:aminotransferase class V-fold PLP-dependent enzyme [Dongiaceae bacterium]
MPARNALFIPGPTNIPEAIRRAMDVPQEDQRAPDFPKFSLGLFRDLKKVFKTAEGQVFLFPGSGSGGWEAALTNTLSPGDRVLAASFGQFSHLWIEMCRRLGLEVDAIEGEWGEGAPVEAYAERLAADREHRIKAVLVCHNETATGVTSDVAALRRALDAAGHPAMLYVDGVSSIASIDFRMDEWGVDLAVAGSQKGFMLPTGLAIVAVSRKALAAAAGAKSIAAISTSPIWRGPTRMAISPTRLRPRCCGAYAPPSTCCRARGSSRCSSATTTSPKACAGPWRPGASSSALATRAGIPTR